MTSTNNTADKINETMAYWEARNAEHSAKVVAATISKWTQDNTKICDHCNNKGHAIENCYKLECEKQEAQQILNDTQCEQCKEFGHAKATCPLIPDSPTTKTRKYNLYIHGGVYQGKKHYGGDHQGGAEYLSDQQNKKYALMTPEEYKEFMEEVADLDDDYMWSRFD